MAPRTKEQNEEVRKKTEEKIITAALSLMVKQGFEATSIKEIANEAGIAVGLMYRYFKSKQHLYEYILNDALNGLKQVVDFVPQIEDPLESLHSIAGVMLNELASDDYINLHLIITNALSFYDAPIIEEIKRVDKLLVEAIKVQIEKGQQLNIFKKGDARKYAWMFLSTIQGLIQAKHTFKEHVTLPTVDELLYYLMEVKR